MGVLDGVGAGLATAGGGIVSTLLNIGEAGKQRNFQSDMANTAYRRAVIDMKLAGINPMLAYMKGGAATPPGAKASVTNALENAVATAQQFRKINEEIKNLREQNALIRAQKNKTTTEDKILKFEETKKGIADDLLQYLKGLVSPEVTGAGDAIKKGKDRLRIEIQK